MKKINKVFYIFCLFATLIIVGLFMCVVYSKYIKKESYPKLFGYTYMQVKTESMYPTLKRNDIVIIKLGSDVNVGDIVTYQDKKHFITHKVIEKADKYIVTKGDSNNSDDGKIDYSRVVGVVTKIISNKVYKLLKYGCVAIIVFLILDTFIRKDNKK